MVQVASRRHFLVSQISVFAPPTKTRFRALGEARENYRRQRCNIIIAFRDLGNGKMLNCKGEVISSSGVARLK